MENATARPKVLLFDVYETLLDMSPVEKRVNTLLDSKRGYLIWFELLMQYCFVDNCTEQFHDFNDIARATLKMSAHQLKQRVNAHDIDNALDLLKYLPVHEEVSSGLSMMHDLNIRVAALTNTPHNTVIERMEVTGLISYFEKIFSADQVKKYKPAKVVYTWAAEQLEVLPHEILLVSSHGWDVAGADNAGLMTAYKIQDRQMLYSLSNRPTFQFKTLEDLCKVLSSLEKR